MRAGSTAHLFFFFQRCENFEIKRVMYCGHEVSFVSGVDFVTPNTEISFRLLKNCLLTSACPFKHLSIPV